MMSLDTLADLESMSTKDTLCLKESTTKPDSTLMSNTLPFVESIGYPDSNYNTLLNLESMSKGNTLVGIESIISLTHSTFQKQLFEKIKFTCILRNKWNCKIKKLRLELPLIGLLLDQYSF